MILPVLVLCLSAILAYSVSSRSRVHRNGSKLKSAPGTLPLLGNAIKFLQPRHVLFDWFVRCQKRFGLETFEIAVPTLPPGVVVNSPQNIEFVLKNEAIITKGEFFRSRSWDLFGHGIINATGELWKAQRKAGLKFFSGTQLDALLASGLPEAYNTARSKLKEHARSGRVVDMQKLFLDLTTSVVGQMAYDMDIDASHPFSQAFDYASDQVGLRFQNPLYPVTEWFTGAKFQEAVLEVKKFGCQIVAKARRDRSREAFESLITNEEPVFEGLIDSLMETFSNPDIVADSALNFLSAGRDTTAQSFTWTLYALSRHHQVIETLQMEIKSKFRNHKAKDGILQLSTADLQPLNIPFTTAVFYEALRLYPPVPFELKQCQADVTLPDGTFLPQGAVVVWCIWAINRSEEMYGKDAESFRPERWLDNQGSFKPRTPFEYPVFNGGPRACLGKKMAEVMSAFLLINLVREFDFQEVLDPQALNSERISQNSLTLPMKGGFPCTVTRIRSI